MGWGTVAAFLARWAANIWEFIKKYWPYVLILLLCIALGISIKIFYAEREAHRLTEMDYQRSVENIQNLEKEVSDQTQVVDITEGELARMDDLRSERDSIAKILGIKNKQIERLHRIVSSSSYSDSVLIVRDTVLLPSGDMNTFNSIPINGGCVSGRAYWMTGQDTAWVELDSKVDISIVDYVAKSKGYVARDIKRFFAFRWKLMGSDKWDAKVKVMNNCDSSQIWEKNLIIKIKK